jgi:hypothetical protein
VSAASPRCRRRPWQDRDLAGLDRAGGGLGVDRVGLAPPAAGGPVGAVDLQHDLACLVQEAGQGGPVAAGALDAEGLDLAESLCPDKQVLVARRRGRDADGANAPAELVFGMGDVDVAVGVDPDRDTGRLGVCDGGDGHLLLPGWGWTARRPGGRTPLREV